MARTIDTGDRAPDFELPSTTGQAVRLADFLGKKNVVLFFYPKDDTPGCTVEACTFRDSFSEFAAAGAEVLGISSDSVASHQRFAAGHQLPMTLLSDQGGKVRARYGVKATLAFLLPGRVTFLIDKQGIVRHVFDSQLRARDHVHQTLQALRRLPA